MMTDASLLDINKCMLIAASSIERTRTTSTVVTPENRRVCDSVLASEKKIYIKEWYR